MTAHRTPEERLEWALKFRKMAEGAHEAYALAMRDAARMLEISTEYESPGETDRLRLALAPFGRAAAHAESFIARVGQFSNITEIRDLYMWQAPRVLSVNDFKNAAKLLEPK